LFKQGVTLDAKQTTKLPGKLAAFFMPIARQDFIQTRCYGCWMKKQVKPIYSLLLNEMERRYIHF